MLIDVVFVILMIMAIIKGFTKGLIVAVFSLVAFIIGMAAAIKLSAVVAGYLQTNANINGWWLPVLSFSIVFIGVVLLVRTGAAIIKKTASLAMLGWLDRLGGILLYMVLYLMIYSVVLFYATQVNLVGDVAAAESNTYWFVKPWAPQVINAFGTIIPVFSNMFTDLKAFFGEIADNGK